MGEQCSNNPSCEASPSAKSSAHGVPPAPALLAHTAEKNITQRSTPSRGAPVPRRADLSSSAAEEKRLPIVTINISFEVIATTRYFTSAIKCPDCLPTASRQYESTSANSFATSLTSCDPHFFDHASVCPKHARTYSR